MLDLRPLSLQPSALSPGAFEGAVLDDGTGEIAAGTVITATGPLDELVCCIAPDTVLCEACSMAPLLRDVVTTALDGCDFRAANTSADAWRWTNTKTKTDAKDCERLIRLYRVGELSTVLVPDHPVLGHDARQRDLESAGNRRDT